MVKDILFNGDIVTKDGDFVVSTSDLQHVEHILIAHPGHYKNAPWIGVGIEDYLNAPTSGIVRQKLEREIKLQLESDGAKNTIISLDNDLQNVKINADYE